MADIVLKDRNGRDVQYPGVNYLKVNTVDGGTQGFAAYDPETLTADNIKTGVEIGDVVGKMVIPDREEKTVDLDFSQGNIMTVMPSTGDELLFNESGVTFAPNPAANNMCLAMDASGFAFETGSEYQVHWDGAVYNCVAYDAAPMDALVGGTGSVAVGNGTFFNLQGNNEPFVFGTVLIGGSRMVILNSLLDTAEATHDVKIYKKIDGGNEKLLSKVDIVKPENLKPENIVKDVDIAGVVGTMEGGGGNILVPLPFFRTNFKPFYKYTSSRTNGQFEISTTLPAGATVLLCTGSAGTAQSTSSTTAATGYLNYTGAISKTEVTVVESDTGVTVTYTESLNTTNYASISVALTVLFTLPGYYITGYNEYGKALAFIDSSAVAVNGNLGFFAEPIAILDATQATFAPLVEGRHVERLLVSPSVTELSTSYQFVSPYIKTVNFGLHTSVPTLKATNVFMNTNMTSNVPTIEVPAALYDEWIAATNWSSLAAYIVAV